MRMRTPRILTRTSDGEDESVYSSEEDEEEDEEDDDEDDSTKPPLGPIGNIFLQRCDGLLETYRDMQRSDQAEDETAETAQSAVSAEIVGSAESAESAETARARASWTEWVDNTDFMQRECVSPLCLIPAELDTHFEVAEQSMWNDRFKPLKEEHERLKSIQAYLASAEFQTAWDASEGSKDPERNIDGFRKRLIRWITHRRLSRLLTRRLSGPNPSEGSGSKRSHSARVSRVGPGQAASTTGKSNKRHQGKTPSKLSEMTHVDEQSPV
jgi:hypothetical protein